ncbi:uncharacterized protein SCHCODRAFT_02679165 [Schizophyllum commune H4-8]|nr:uncharacterized protein SCHCODRAFT_02679165 [Schizophyllum commune H4-8]KAI5889939.1 hypothetical protein SCHCODRAFT_02679165 [Schizophyllum commune H4-8]
MASLGYQQLNKPLPQPPRIILFDEISVYVDLPDPVMQDFVDMPDLPPLGYVLNDIYVLVQNSEIINHYIDSQLRPIMEAYTPEHPVVQSYSAYIYWSARLFDNITAQFSKIFKLKDEKKLYWGRPEFKRSDRHLLHFMFSLNRVHHAIRAPLHTLVEHSHILTEPFTSDYRIREVLQELHAKIVDIDKKIFKWVSIAEEFALRRQIRMKEHEEEEARLHVEIPLSEEARKERKDKYHSETMNKLCANEMSVAHADSVEVLQQRLDQSKATRAMYKKHY